MKSQQFSKGIIAKRLIHNYYTWALGPLPLVPLFEVMISNHCMDGDGDGYGADATKSFCDERETTRNQRVAIDDVTRTTGESIRSCVSVVSFISMMRRRGQRQRQRQRQRQGWSTAVFGCVGFLLLLGARMTTVTANVSDPCGFLHACLDDDDGGHPRIQRRFDPGDYVCSPPDRYGNGERYRFGLTNPAVSSSLSSSSLGPRLCLCHGGGDEHLKEGEERGPQQPQQGGKRRGCLVWCVGTSEGSEGTGNVKKITHARMQSDGNLVAYGGDKFPVWSSQTSLGSPVDAQLDVTDDGSVRIIAFDFDDTFSNHFGFVDTFFEEGGQKTENKSTVTVLWSTPPDDVCLSPSPPISTVNYDDDDSLTITTLNPFKLSSEDYLIPTEEEEESRRPCGFDLSNCLGHAAIVGKKYGEGDLLCFLSEDHQYLFGLCDFSSSSSLPSHLGSEGTNTGFTEAFPCMCDGNSGEVLWEAERKNKLRPLDDHDEQKISISSMGEETFQAHFKLQADGNLVYRDEHGQVFWTSQTAGNDGAVLKVTDSGTVELSVGTTVLWSTDESGLVFSPSPSSKHMLMAPPIPSASTTTSTLSTMKTSMKPSSSSSSPAVLPDLVLYVVADTPYNVNDIKILKRQIEMIPPDADAVLHLGDIMSGGGLPYGWNEEAYTKVAEVLAASPVPVFVVPGDNEINDAPGHRKAVERWTDAFRTFPEGLWGDHEAVRKWNITRPPTSSSTSSHDYSAAANLSFLYGRVLVAAVDVVGGIPHNLNEWKRRHDAIVDFVAEQLRATNAEALLLLAHGRPRYSNRDFFDALHEWMASSEQTNRTPHPEDGDRVLYVHGDGHIPEDHSLYGFRCVQVDRGNNRWLRLTVRPHGDENANGNNPFFDYRHLNLLRSTMV